MHSYKSCIGNCFLMHKLFSEKCRGNSFGRCFNLKLNNEHTEYSLVKQCRIEISQSHWILQCHRNHAKSLEKQSTPPPDKDYDVIPVGKLIVFAHALRNEKISDNVRVQSIFFATGLSKHLSVNTLRPVKDRTSPKKVCSFIKCLFIYMYI